jgi:hypothetical protein
MTKTILFFLNYNQFFISFVFFLMIIQLSTSHMNIFSEVYALSPPVVRQEVIDDGNDWQPWKIKNENEKEIQNEKCENPLILLPDIQSLSYLSDGNKLNVTLWLTQTFSEILYEDILKNETFSDMSEITSDFSLILQSIHCHHLLCQELYNL